MTLLIAFYILSWSHLRINVPPSFASTIAVTDTYTFFTINRNDSLYIYLHRPDQEKYIYSIIDTTGTYSISAFDSILIFAHVAKDTVIEIVKIKDTLVDSVYTIISPERCNSIKMYNDGMVHPFSYPVWYMICRGESGIFLTHSTNFASSFYPFDTVLNIYTRAFDFITSKNSTGDRLHLIFVTYDSVLYLANGAYPGNFDTIFIKIDSMLPDTPHVSISAKEDTLFVSYERISSETHPDRDIYYVAYYHEGNDNHPIVQPIAATFDEETFPISIMEFTPHPDTIHLFYLKYTSPIELQEALVISPYSDFNTRTVYAGDIKTIHVSNWYSKIAFIITLNDSSTLLFANYPILVREKRSRKKVNPATGIYTIDGRKLKAQPARGIFIENGKKIIKLK